MRFAHLLALLAPASVLFACGPATPASDPQSASITKATEPESSVPAGTTPAGEPQSKVVAEGGMCGGLAGFTCSSGLYCSFPPEAMCGAADQTGACTPMPQVCTQEFAPVCGCNDKTYPNACYAAREGVSVGKKGEC